MFIVNNYLFILDCSWFPVKIWLEFFGRLYTFVFHNYYQRDYDNLVPVCFFVLFFCFFFVFWWWGYGIFIFFLNYLIFPSFINCFNISRFHATVFVEFFFHFSNFIHYRYTYIKSIIMNISLIMANRITRSARIYSKVEQFVHTLFPEKKTNM